MLNHYKFKALEELLWAALTAIGVTLLMALAGFDPDSIADGRVWLVSLGAACIRAGAAAVLNTVRMLAGSE